MLFGKGGWASSERDTGVSISSTPAVFAVNVPACSAPPPPVARYRAVHAGVDHRDRAAHRLDRIPPLSSRRSGVPVGIMR